MKTLISITPDAGRGKTGEQIGRTVTGCLCRRAGERKGLLCAASACALVLLCPMRSLAGPLDPLAFPSLGILSLADGSGSYTIDTSGPTPTLRDAANNVLFTGTTLAQPTSTFDPTIAVFDFASVYIGSGVQVQVSGTNPLALLSQSTVNIQGGTINADGQKSLESGDNGPGGLGGPGGGKGGVGAIILPNNPLRGGGTGQGPGGGIGGVLAQSWGCGGGFGGNGGLSSNLFLGSGTGMAYGDLNLALEGGSGGGGSGGSSVSVGGGGGGGAVEIGAITEILGGDATVTANGGASDLGDAAGHLRASGAGSGGGLFFHAPQIRFTGNSMVSANGGNNLGGGGRILFLTTTGALDSAPATLSVNAGAVEGPPFLTCRSQGWSRSASSAGGLPRRRSQRRRSSWAQVCLRRSCGVAVQVRAIIRPSPAG